MNDSQRRPEPPDLSGYEENRAKFSLEKLAQYEGRHVAFSADGTRIVASGKDWPELWKHLEEAGIDASQVVGGYVPPADTVLLGGLYNLLPEGEN
jgi:Family of unknown function (DUF5678)